MALSPAPPFLNPPPSSKRPVQQALIPTSQYPRRSTQDSQDYLFCIVSWHLQLPSARAHIGHSLPPRPLDPSSRRANAAIDLTTRRRWAPFSLADLGQRTQYSCLRVFTVQLPAQLTGCSSELPTLSPSHHGPPRRLRFHHQPQVAPLDASRPLVPLQQGQAQQSLLHLEPQVQPVALALACPVGLPLPGCQIRCRLLLRARRRRQGPAPLVPLLAE